MMTEKFPYKIFDKQQLISKINHYSKTGIPFLFIIDYNAETGFFIPENELNDDFVSFKFQTKNQNRALKNEKSEEIIWKISPVSLKKYEKKFQFVVDQIHKGNSFLTNLTQPTGIETNLSLKELFRLGSARYKLWLKDRFTVLSPETFVKIENGIISSFPMKGTIDASLPDAENVILNDAKEKAEHATIVDLIRNDLSTVAEQVEVKRYRYVERLTTNRKDLLQVSSEITGHLPDDYIGQLGDILFSLLPAGSISGAPKPKTLEIIEQAEGYERGFYTGICGWFDGKNLDSAVMIRFVEQQGDKLVFKSGGGITSKSDVMKEYEELIQKVYVPVC